MLETLVSTYGRTARPDHRAAVVVVDVNEALTSLDMPRTSRLSDIRPDLKRRPGMVWTPPPEGATFEEWNELFRTVYLAPGPVVLVLDETYAANVTFQRRGFLEALLTRGRARQKGMILGVQRPSQIPLHMLAQADHFVAFDLPLEEDRRRMARTMGEKSSDGRSLDDRAALPRYSAWVLTPALSAPEEVKIGLDSQDDEEEGDEH